VQIGKTLDSVREIFRIGEQLTVPEKYVPVIKTGKDIRERL
jgi:hypothetical protein